MALEPSDGIRVVGGERWDHLIGDGEEECGVGVEEGAYERCRGRVRRGQGK